MGPAIRGVLLGGIPNFSIYLYTCLFLFLTDVLLSPLFSSISLARFFSVIKIYVQSCTRCVHIAFRLAQCSFCTKLRIHLKRVYTHKHAHADICTCRKIYTYMYIVVSLLLSRARFFPLHPEFDKFICLCGAIGPHLAVIVVGKSTKRKRATKGPPMTVSFQRKRNCGGPAAESSTRCIYRSKIGIKKGRATRTRGARFRPII